MVSDAYIYRAASKLIDEHGAKAVSEAARLVSKALRRQDKDGAAIMLRVRVAIANLQAQPNSSVH